MAFVPVVLGNRCDSGRVGRKLIKNRHHVFAFSKTIDAIPDNGSISLSFGYPVYM